MQLNTLHQIRRSPLLLKSLVIDEHLYEHLEEIACNCRRLLQLQIGRTNLKSNHNGEIWNGQESINCLEYTGISDELEESDDDEEQFELDVKLIANYFHDLKKLYIGSGLQLKRQPVAPPTLDQLTQLEELQICPLKPGVRCDRSRNEWNIRVLAQSSKVLKRLDLRGCYLKILSLGWLETDQLEALHLYYQVPAVSVLFKWSRTLKYLTLARISHRYRAYRSMGPDKPHEELDACLINLASVDESQLTQLDLQESDCSYEAIKFLALNCKRLSYLDTRDCCKLNRRFRNQLMTRESIISIFSWLNYRLIGQSGVYTLTSGDPSDDGRLFVTNGLIYL